MQVPLRRKTTSFSLESSVGTSCQLLTSSILMAEVGEPPDVAKSHREADLGQDILPFGAPGRSSSRIIRQQVQVGFAFRSYCRFEVCFGFLHGWNGNTDTHTDTDTQRAEFCALRIFTDLTQCSVHIYMHFLEGCPQPIQMQMPVLARIIVNKSAGKTERALLKVHAFFAQ